VGNGRVILEGYSRRACAIAEVLKTYDLDFIESCFIVIDPVRMIDYEDYLFPDKNPCEINAKNLYILTFIAGCESRGFFPRKRLLADNNIKEVMFRGDHGDMADCSLESKPYFTHLLFYLFGVASAAGFRQVISSLALQNFPSNEILLHNGKCVPERIQPVTLLWEEYDGGIFQGRAVRGTHYIVSDELHS
jgi:hypothetical protein